MEKCPADQERDGQEDFPQERSWRRRRMKGGGKPPDASRLCPRGPGRGDHPPRLIARGKTNPYCSSAVPLCVTPRCLCPLTNSRSKDPGGMHRRFVSGDAVVRVPRNGREEGFAERRIMRFLKSQVTESSPKACFPFKKHPGVIYKQFPFPNQESRNGCSPVCGCGRAVGYLPEILRVFRGAA